MKAPKGRDESSQGHQDRIDVGPRGKSGHEVSHVQREEDDLMNMRFEKMEAAMNKNLELIFQAQRGTTP